VYANYAGLVVMRRDAGDGRPQVGVLGLLRHDSPTDGIHEKIEGKDSEGVSMKTRTLGMTGLQVSEIGLGAYPISGMWQRSDGSSFGWTGIDDRESIALIHRAEELGVNLIDTAEGYGDGHSELLTGNALQGRRDQWVVATKVQPNQGIDENSPDATAVRRRIIDACEESLKRLQMETIDVYQLHAIPYEWAMPVVMDTLAQLKTAGKIRWYGISTNNREAVDKLHAFGPIHVLQIGYNLLERSADPLLNWAKSKDIGTLIRVPLAKGMLSGKYSGEGAVRLPSDDLRYERFNRLETIDGLRKLPQLTFLATPERSLVQASLRFVLDHPGVTSVIAGAKNRRQIEENAAASELPLLTESELARALPIADSIRTPGWI
jgi:aryl-alcohol dehydrogenase-like predicted oxidoreductase